MGIAIGGVVLLVVIAALIYFNVRDSKQADALNKQAAIDAQARAAKPPTTPPGTNA